MHAWSGRSREYICRVKDKRVHMQRVKERDREQKDGVWKVKKKVKGERNRDYQKERERKSRQRDIGIILEKA